MKKLVNFSLLETGLPFRTATSAAGILLCTLLIAGASGELWAQPAPLDAGSWKSVDQFIQSDDNAQDIAQDLPDEPKETAQTVSTPSTKEDAKTKGPKVVATPAPANREAKVAEPEYDDHVIVDSTADGPDQKLLRQAIQPPKAGSSNFAEITPDQDKTKPVNPYKVRLAGLPSIEIKPAPAQPAVRPKKKLVKKEEKPRPKVSKEACEALSALQKRELSAIEKDRETLAALQAAIKDLGLSNKLNFTEGKGSLLGSPNQDALKSTPVPEKQSASK